MNRPELIRMLDDLFHDITWSVTDVHKRAGDVVEGGYPYIAASPIDQYNLFKYVSTLFRGRKLYTKDIKFLDCGCGLGLSMQIARKVGFDAYGLEYSPSMIKLGRSLSPYFYSRSFIKADITTYKDYDKYDVIYYFRPLSDPKKQDEFEKYLENECKVGAYLICLYKQDKFSLSKDKRFKLIKIPRGGDWRRWSPQIWKKIKHS